MTTTEMHKPVIPLFENPSIEDQKVIWNILSTGYFTQVPLVWRTAAGFNPTLIRYQPEYNTLVLDCADLDVTLPVAYPGNEPVDNQIPWDQLLIDTEELKHLQESDHKRALLYPKQRVPETMPRITQGASERLLPVPVTTVDSPPENCPTLHPTVQKIATLWTKQDELNEEQRIRFDAICIKLQGETVKVRVEGETVIVQHPDEGDFILLPYTVAPADCPTPSVTLGDLLIGHESLESIHALHHQLTNPRRSGFNVGLDLPPVPNTTNRAPEAPVKVREQERIQRAAITMVEHLQLASRKEYKMSFEDVIGMGTVITFTHHAGNPNTWLPLDKHPPVRAAWDTLRQSSFIYNRALTNRQNTLLIEDGINLGVIDLPANNSFKKSSPELEIYRQQWLSFLTKLDQTVKRYDRSASTASIKQALQARQISLQLLLTQIITSPPNNPHRRPSTWQLGSIQGYSFGIALIPHP